MTTFQYKAFDKRKGIVRGNINAENSKAARQKIKQQGYFLISIHERKWLGSLLFSQKKILKKLPIEQQAFLAQQLSLLLGASLTVEQALLTISEQSSTNSPLHSICTKTREKVIMGHSLADALEEHETCFAEVFCTLVRSGELSGTLVIVLESLSHYLNTQNANQNKILQTLLYPCIVVAFSCIVITVMMVYVIPEMVGIFQHAKKELPLLTRSIIAISNFFIQYGIALIFIIIGLCIWLKFLWKKEKYKAQIQKILCHLPGIGQLLLIIDMARFCQSLSIMLHASIPLTIAIDTIKNVVWLLPIREKITRIHKAIYEGTALSHAIKKEGGFPPLLITMVSSGESTNNMDMMLSRAGTIFQNKHEQQVLLFITLIEPLLIIIIGGLVLTIILAILMPILEINTMAV